MRLYLSSQGLAHPAAVASLLERDSLAGVRVGLVENAGETESAKERAVKHQWRLADFESLGLVVVPFDLRDYGAETLPAALATLDLLWVAGGNTFCLRQRLCDAGFDRAGVSALEEGLVYAGESAGAIVAGPSLEPIAGLDEPEKAEERIDKGLWLVPFVVIPHWHAPGREQPSDAALAKARELGLEPLPLEDGQAVVVDGRESKLLY